MSTQSLERLPDDAHVWLFGAAAPLGPEEQGRIRTAIEEFAGGWQSHGEDVGAAIDVIEDRFLLVAVDPAVARGGCGIDKLYRRVREMRASGIDLLDASLVFWNEDGAFVSDSRAGFRRRAEIGEVGPDTIVADLTVDTLGGVRSSAWKRRAADSWHAAAFDLAKVH
ncbi:MAG TPA: hypothetical protein VMS56_09200 [Thermoanaerobaculia bacterium]|nr:hypothetical protein [Thermoanaerobaculia bacterium]